jgi:hypothetical protein
MDDDSADDCLLVIGIVVILWFSAIVYGEEMPIAPPVRQCCEQMPPTLADILRRLPDADARTARHDDDPITWGHEGHHFLHSRLSTAGTRAFYVLDGYAYRFPIPKQTRLTHVMAAVPEHRRGKVFATYLVNSREWWDDCALYPFDEALAYWSGAMIRQEIGNPKRQETERYAVELTVYSLYAVQEIVRREPDTYPKEELLDFLDLVVARGRLICPEFDQQPHADALANYGHELIKIAEAADGKE